MANTTNYNWETPDDTDLVKDGAAAIRTLGNSIDTTTKALNPETTLGDIAYRSATSNTNTRLPIGTSGQILSVSGGVPAWINNDQGDITEVAAGTGISVASGTGPVPTVSINTAVTADLTTAQTLTNKTLTSPVLTTPTISTIDAKGDLLVGTADNTIGRLAVGTNGHILTADSTVSPTGLKWAAPAASSSALTFITSASPSASAATNVNSCFTSTYDNYKIIYYLTATTTSNNRLALRMRASGSDLTSSYKNAGSYTNGADGAIGFNDLETGYIMLSQNDSGAPHMAYGVIEILRPQASDYTRLVINSSGYNGTTQYSYEFRTFVNNTTSYDGFTIYVPSGNVTGNFKVYGYSNS